MPDTFFRSRQTQFRSAEPADGQPMVLEGYFVVFDQPYPTAITYSAGTSPFFGGCCNPCNI